MRVSVVIPARNEEAFLPRCLERIAHQTLRPFEVIVVESGSTDRTAQVAKDHGARVIRLEEPGIARARHAGFQAAVGEVIASTDADALVPRDWLERLVSPFEDPRVVGVCGSFVYEGGYRLLSFNFLRGPLLKLGLTGFPGPNFAVRKQAFLSAGGFLLPDGNFPQSYPDFEDILLGLKVRRLGRIVYLPDLVVRTSSRRFPRALVQYQRGWFRLLRYLWWSFRGSL